jgi:hypothetical protein
MSITPSLQKNMQSENSLTLNAVYDFSTHTGSNPWTGPEGSKKLRFPDFKTIGT